MSSEDQCVAVHLRFNHTEVQARRNWCNRLGNPAIVRYKYIKMWVFFFYWGQLGYIYISIMRSILWMMRLLQRKNKNLWGCVTWKLATCFAAALNPELVGCFLRKSWWEVELTELVCNHSFCSWLMRPIISAGITQYVSCDLHAPDWEEPEDCKSNDRHPMHGVKAARVWSVQGVIYPVCFILMPPCCQSDKTFATEAVTIHLRQIRLPHCFWMIILQHHVSHWFILKESQ